MNHFIYIGTYTETWRGKKHRPEGIIQFQFNPKEVTLEQVGVTRDTLNPGFLAVHPNRRFMYAINELPESTVSAFAIDPTSGALTLLNLQPTRGAATCYVSCDPAGRWVMVSSYSSGSLAVFPIAADGSLGEMADFVQHQGSGQDPRRQEGPHAHSIRFDPTGRFVLAADLGLDQVKVYRLDAKTGKLMPNDPPALQVAPGAGPRHFDFSPSGRFVYVANELDSTVTACTWDSRQGAMAAFQTLSTLPAGFKGQSSVADIHLTPGGEWLYVSNRGHDSLAVYAVDRHSGQLSARGYVHTGGQVPRNFAIDPSGEFLLAANQNTSNLVLFRLDPAQGSPIPTGVEAAVPSPVCVIFFDL